jgi:NADH-quinone oxidoreductase subunit A
MNRSACERLVVTTPDPDVGLAVHVAVCVALGVGLPAAAALLRHRVRHGRPDRSETYECGELPVGPAWRQTPVGFYLLALLFILFDAEVAFLFLWVVSLREVGVQAFWAMVVFLGVLLAGWAYAWRKGDLSWTR